MAVIGNTYLDLLDVIKQRDPKGNIAPVIEMLMQLNPMMEDAVAVQCNNGTSHTHLVRTGLPDGAWGKLYKGTPASKSEKEQVTDVTGFYEQLAEIDERVLELAGSTGHALRLNEAKAHLEAIAQEMQATMIYGSDVTAPEEFMGLAPRFNDKSAQNGNQIIDCVHTTPDTDNTSIWWVHWSDSTCFTLYPEGTQAGIKRKDYGLRRVEDSDSNPYFAYSEKFTQHCGIGLADWRYVVRIANIQNAELQADPTNVDGNNNSLYHFMRKAFYQFEGRRFPQSGTSVIYCNKDVLEALDALGTNAGSNDIFARLKPMEIQGKEVLTYRGIPIRETDALHNAEATVT